MQFEYDEMSFQVLLFFPSLLHSWICSMQADVLQLRGTDSRGTNVQPSAISPLNTLLLTFLKELKVTLE